MNIADFKEKIKKLTALANTHGWNLLSTDSNTGRITLKEEMTSMKMDIYTSKMTVCLQQAGEKTVYLKKQTFEMIDKLLSNPFIHVVN